MAYLGGVLIPLLLIYALEAIGFFHFENKILPGVIVVAGSIVLIILEEGTKFVFKILKEKEE